MPLILPPSHTSKYNQPPLPLLFFRELEGLLTQLIWGNDRHRIALATLKLAVDEGGMAVPDFELYYITAQLQWVVHWSAVLWDGIEFWEHPTGRISHVCYWTRR